MNKTFCFYFILLLVVYGCKTRYKTLDNKAYLTNKSHGLDTHKFYQNDSLDITLEIPWDDKEYSTLGLNYFKGRKRQRHVFSVTKVNPKKDYILFIDPWTIIVLKKSKINLSGFKHYNAEDTTLQHSIPDKPIKQFYRKTIIEKRKKLIVSNDLIPFGKYYLSIISYDQHESKGGYSAIDITDPDNISVFGNKYKNSLKIANKNAYNLNLHNRFININPFLLMDGYFKTGKYGNYRATHLGEPKSSQYNRPTDQQLYNKVMSTYYSFAHETHKADSLLALLTHQSGDSIFKQNGSIEDLLKRADSAQVVMFNEANNFPQHRYLLGTLLERFYQKGFRYLGLEAFTNDSLLTSQGFPTSANGLFLREPVMANLVRVANNMRFKVFGYDSPYDNTRDIDQAKNIYDKTIRKDAKAKVLILGGYEHIDKRKMAGRFEIISGINPLTIDQSYTFLHRLNHENNKDEAYIIQDMGLKNKPDVDLMLWNDLIIKNNCFSLLESKPVKVIIPDSLKKEVTIICIYSTNELNISNRNIPIPVELHVLDSKETSVEFFLSPAEYKILYLDNYGDVLFEDSLHL